MGFGVLIVVDVLSQSRLAAYALVVLVFGGMGYYHLTIGRERTRLEKLDDQLIKSALEEE